MSTQISANDPVFGGGAGAPSRQPPPEVPRPAFAGREIRPRVDPVDHLTPRRGCRPACRGQFAEMVYLMVMSSEEMRAKVKAMARRYGLCDIETREDVIRYFNRLTLSRYCEGRRPDETPACCETSMRELQTDRRADSQES